MNGVTGTDGEQLFLDELIRHGLFFLSGEAGVYGRGELFEEVRMSLDAFISSIGAADRPEKLRFPPLIPKSTLEKAGYLKSFPHLCGAITSFTGGDAEACDLTERAARGDSWGEHFTMTNVVLVPAACYPAYPVIAQRGALPKRGVTLDLGPSYVFRNEPSGDPARLQMFHQREMVRMGEADDVLEWRETWMRRGSQILADIGLDHTLDTASDPFFGRGGKFLAKTQREQRLKFELLVPIASPKPTAVTSFNYHHEHFGSAFGIHLHDGRLASTACLGFGSERITLALFKAHGMDLDSWPASVRKTLWPNGREHITQA